MLLNLQESNNIIFNFTGGKKINQINSRVFIHPRRRDSIQVRNELLNTPGSASILTQDDCGHLHMSERAR